jgi:hypothetical protein
MRTDLVFGVDRIDVPLAEPSCVVFWLTMTPLPAAAAEGYAEERVSIAIWSHGRIIAVPLDSTGRTWHHRYGGLFKELCLFDPADPRPLRWNWNDGLAAYVMIVYKHLLSEEYARRNGGRWPCEDSPHGFGPHPIRSPAMQTAVQRVA